MKNFSNEWEQFELNPYFLHIIMGYSTCSLTVIHIQFTLYQTPHGKSTGRHSKEFNPYSNLLS